MFSLCRSPIAADIKNLCMVELACLEDQRHMAMGERRSSQQSAMEEQRSLGLRGGPHVEWTTATWLRFRRLQRYLMQLLAQIEAWTDPYLQAPDMRKSTT